MTVTYTRGIMNPSSLLALFWCRVLHMGRPQHSDDRLLEPEHFLEHGGQGLRWLRQRGRSQHVSLQQLLRIYLQARYDVTQLFY